MADSLPSLVLPWLVVAALLLVATVAPLLVVALILGAIALFWPGPGGLTPIPVTLPERRGTPRGRSSRGPPQR
jgi:hypothetical protein